MGQAKSRGTFEERKTQAIAAGRIPAIRRAKQAKDKANRRVEIEANLAYLRKLNLFATKF